MTPPASSGSSCLLAASAAAADGESTLFPSCLTDSSSSCRLLVSGTDRSLMSCSSTSTTQHKHNHISTHLQQLCLGCHFILCWPAQARPLCACAVSLSREPNSRGCRMGQMWVIHYRHELTCAYFGCSMRSWCSSCCTSRLLPGPYSTARSIILGTSISHLLYNKSATWLGLGAGCCCLLLEAATDDEACSCGCTLHIHTCAYNRSGGERAGVR